MEKKRIITLKSECEKILDFCEVYFFRESQRLPLVIEPKAGLSLSLFDLTNEKKNLEILLSQYGAILFRGFKLSSIDEFNDFISGVSTGALPYSERSSPRHSVFKNIYTSTDHPNDKEIIQHSEQSYNKSFPRKIFFYCEKVPQFGGNTPLADARRIYRRIPESILAKFEKKHYRYSRYFWQVIGTTWQTAFQMEDKIDVEEYCERNDIHFEWQPGGALKTYQVRPTTAYHPVTGEACWFNHCSFFNILSLDDETREIMMSSFDSDKLPNQTFYGDGERIESEVIRQLQAAYESEKVEFDWQEGDVLMIDNILVTHGRNSYKGDRSILVGMSEVTHWANVNNKSG